MRVGVVVLVRRRRRVGRLLGYLVGDVWYVIALVLPFVVDLPGSEREREREANTYCQRRSLQLGGQAFSRCLLVGLVLGV